MPPLRLMLAGDTMLGRGIDQILPFRVNPVLHEDFVNNAKVYTELAVRRNGPVPVHRPVDYVWGILPSECRRRGAHARIINLETSVTTSEEHAAGKAVCYRMHPGNVESVIKRAGVHVCTLANNHVLDYGVSGLLETLDSLHASGIQTAGAGRNLAEARKPAVVYTEEGRVLTFAIGSVSSGVPTAWAAAEHKPGVNLIEPIPKNVPLIREMIHDGGARPDDVVVLSVHWDSNWSFHIPPSHIAFAHDVIDYAGVDVVFGHSSHHVKAMERHGRGLIMYGAGEALDDYEGITNSLSQEETFRGDLGALYFVSLDMPPQARTAAAAAEAAAAGVDLDVAATAPAPATFSVPAAAAAAAAARAQAAPEEGEGTVDAVPAETAAAAVLSPPAGAPPRPLGSPAGAAARASARAPAPAGAEEIAGGAEVARPVVSNVELVPIQIRNLRINHADGGGARWVLENLRRECQPFKTKVSSGVDGTIHVSPMML